MDYILYKDVSDYLRSYYLENKKCLTAPTVMLDLIKQKKTSKQKNTFKKFLTLSHEEFIDCINNTQISSDIINTLILPKKSRGTIVDSALIPYNLDCYVLKLFNYNNTPENSHSCFDVYYVYEGDCTIVFEGKAKALTEGNICITSPESMHNIIVNGDSLVLSLSIRKSTFDKTFFNVLSEFDIISAFVRSIFYKEHPTANYLIFTNNNDRTIKAIIKSLYTETNYVDEYSNSTCIHYINLLFITILRDFRFNDCFYKFHNSNDHLLGLIIEYIQENYKTINLKILAQKFNYNETYLSKLLKSRLNIGFVDLLTNCRLQHAKDLLLNTNMSIESIAYEIGYTSVDHFSRIFKKNMELSPNVYRKRITIK
ncbi:AraC family transcriptional regulator [Clostridium sp. YIM B02555]|uniref:AraC family transcriptional regulator n=1 Tax=Clostridium sp. YIM B02555 TaxID=2911968 RepID=UPI001EEDC291|nr:AraC family transcriptional regulator [Clostridium sp. YIM B02555]